MVGNQPSPSCNAKSMRADRSGDLGLPTVHLVLRPSISAREKSFTGYRAVLY
jgi:hypothetical protein